jgi:AraC-like DNA-binding protein
MSYREQPVHGPLADWVECAWRRSSGDVDYARIVPDGCTDLLWSPAAGLVVVGPNTAGFVSELPPGGHSLGVRLHPGRGAALFGLPGPALRDARMAAAEVWGDAGARLEEAVAEAPDAAAETMLRHLAGRARRARRPEPLVSAAAARLADRPDRVAAVDRDLAVSERHLRRLVTAEVGYGPKLLARVLRLRRSLARVRAGAELAEVAFSSGYADQAHFTHDCRELAGTTPAAFRP